MEPSIESLTRITMRPLGSPLPLGFLAFGTGILLLTALDAHWIPPGDQRLVAALALGFCVPLELLAAIFGFLARDTAGGTTMGLFGASWIASALFMLLTPPGTESVAMTFLWGALGVAALVLAATAMMAKPFFSLLLAAAAARFGTSAAHEAGVTGAIEPIGTALGIALVVLALYGALALLLEDGKRHTVLPLFRMGEAKTALEGDLHDQLRDVSKEPGVRLQL
jgi:hypothetical protein